jgi:hypothetical protein
MSKLQTLWFQLGHLKLINRFSSPRFFKKPFAVPKHFPRESSEARPILQTLGVIYSIEWALRHCDTIIGECIVPAFSSLQIAHMLHVAYTSCATLATQCSTASQSQRQVVSMMLGVNQIYQRCQIWNSLPPRLIIDRGFPEVSWIKPLRA